MADPTFFDVTNISPVPFKSVPGEEKPLLDLGPSREEQEKQWQEALKRAREQFFLTWKKQKEVEGKSVPYTSFQHLQQEAKKRDKIKLKDIIIGALTPAGAPPLDPKLTDTPAERGHRVLIEDFDKAWNTVQAERIKKLDPIFLKLEIELGGARAGTKFDPFTGNELPPLGPADAFAGSLLNSASFGILKGGLRDPIYGDKFNEHFSKSSSTGDFIGTLIALKSIGGFLRSAGVAAQLANIIQKHGMAARVVRATGQIPAAMRAQGKIYRGLSGFIRSGRGAWYGARTLFKPVTTQLAQKSIEQGTAQIMSGLMFGLHDAAKSATRRLIREDTLDPKELEKAQNPFSSFLSGLARGWGIGAINGPSNWGWRLVGDAVWSAVQQHSRVLFGQQKEFDWGGYMFDFLISHAVGEQNMVFKWLRTPLSRDKLDPETRITHERIAEIYRYLKMDPELKRMNLSDDQLRYGAAQAWGLEMQAAGANLRSSPELFASIIGQVKKPLINNAPGIENAYYRNYNYVDTGNPLDLLGGYEKRLTTALRDTLNLTQRQERNAMIDGAAASPERLYNFLRQYNIKKPLTTDLDPLSTVTKKPELDGISENTFLDRMFSSIKEHVARGGRTRDLVSFKRLTEMPADEILRFFKPVPEDTELRREGENIYTSPDKAVTATQKPDVGGFTEALSNRIRTEIFGDIRGVEWANSIKKRLRKWIPKNMLDDAAVDTYLKAGNASDRLLADASKQFNQLQTPADIKNAADFIVKKAINSTITQIRAGLSGDLKRAGKYKYLSKEMSENLYSNDSSIVDAKTGDIVSGPGGVKRAGIPDEIALAAGRHASDDVLMRAEAEKIADTRLEAFKARIKDATQKGGAGLEEGKRTIRDTRRISSNTEFNTDLEIMARIAKGHPRSMVSVLARYWRDTFGLNTSQVAAHLKKYGFIRKPSELQSMYSNIKPKTPTWKRALAKLTEVKNALKGATQDEAYSRKDARLLWRDIVSKYDLINRVSGLPSKIDITFEQEVNKTGGLVFGVENFRRANLALGGEVYARRGTQAAAEFINTIIVDRNKQFVGKRGEPGLRIRHLDAENNTVFIITGDKLGQEMFQSMVLDIHKLLTKGYDEVPNVEDRQFAFRINETFYDKIPGLTTTYVTDIKDIIPSQRAHNRLREAALKYLDASPETVNEYFDKIWLASFEKYKTQFNEAITEIDAIEQAPGLKVFDFLRQRAIVKPKIRKILQSLFREDVDRIESGLVPEDHNLPAVVRGDMAVENSKAMGDSLKDQAVERNIVESSSILETVDEKIVVDKPLADDDFGFVEAHQRAVKAISDEANRIRENYEQVAPRKEEILRDFYDDTSDSYFKGRLSVFEDNKKIKPREIDVLTLHGRREEISKNVTFRSLYSVFNPLPLFNQKRLKGLKGSEYKIEVKRQEVFRKFWDFFLEMEAKSMFRNGDIVRGNEIRKDHNTESIVEKLSKPPSHYDKLAVYIEELMVDPSRMDNRTVLELRSFSKDPLLLAKIMVQKCGIKPQDLIDFVVRAEEFIYGPVNRMFAEYGGYQGSYTDARMWEAVTKKMLYHIDRFVKKFDRKADRSVDIAKEIYANSSDNKAAATALEKLIARVDNNYRAGVGVPKEKFDIQMADYTRALQRTLRRIGSIRTIDPSKQKYIPHRILTSPAASRIARDTLKDIEEGRTSTAPAVEDEAKGWNPFKHRQVPTLEDLARLGIPFQMDGLMTMQALHKYMLMETANLELAAKWRNDFIRDNIQPSLDIIDEHRLEYNKLVKSVRDDPPATAFNTLWKFVSKADQLGETIAKKFGDNKGVFWRWNSEDLRILTRKIKKIKSAIDITQSKEERKRLGEELAKAENLKRVGEREVDLLSGQLVYRLQYDVLEKFKNAKREDGKPFMDPAQRNRMKEEVKGRAAQFRDRMGKILHDYNEKYVPLHTASHNRDKDPDSNFSKWGLGYLFDDSAFPTRVEKNFIHEPSLKGFQGLYAHRAMVKGIQDFLFRPRNELIEGNYTTTVKGRRVYDYLNGMMKSFKFYKPQIIVANDMAQAMLGVGPIRFIRHLPWAFKTFFNRRAMDNNEYYKDYWFFNEGNLFHKTVGMPGLIPDSVDVARRVVGESLATTIWKQLGGTARDIKDAAAKKDLFQTVSRFSKTVLGSWHEIQKTTWGMDEILRLSVAKTFYNRFYPIQLQNAIDDGLSGDAAINRARLESRYLAVKRANLFTADYSRIPLHTRRSLNRIFLVPTFKIAELRMYKEMFKEAGQAWKVLAGKMKPGEVGYQASKNRINQALFMMAPLLRKLIFTTAIKGGLYGMLGYEFEDTLDMITGYRASKIVNRNNPLEENVEYLSLGTPLFSMEKYFTRLVPGRMPNGLLSLIRYSLATMPGLGLALATNSHSITGQPIWSQNDSAATVGRKMGLFMLENFLPAGGAIHAMNREDVSLMGQILQTSGLGVSYRTGTANELMEDFRDAVDRSRSLADRKRAMMNFSKGLQRLSFEVNKRKFRTIYQLIADYMDQDLED